jgi:hypothetical protein
MVGSHRRVAQIGLLIVSVFFAACGTSSPSATKDPVMLTIMALSYGPSDTIQVTLKNGSNGTIYFSDHNTNCTIIQLQVMYSGSSDWQPVQNCAQYSASTLHVLDKGESVPVPLLPLAGFWQIGTYEATLSYATSPDAPLKTISSARFSVAGSPGGSLFPGPQPTATKDLVALIVMAPPCAPSKPISCAPSDTIQVTLKNGSNGTIYFFRNYTNCTSILLQLEVTTNKWNDIENCKPKPGEKLTLKPLAPSQTMVFSLKPPTEGWQTGIYRAALEYSTSDAIPPTTQVDSDGFVVAEGQTS